MPFDEIDEFLNRTAKGRTAEGANRQGSPPSSQPIDEIDEFLSRTSAPQTGTIEKPANRPVRPKPLTQNEQRNKQAAQIINAIEAGRERSTRLFQAADRTDPGKLSTVTQQGGGLPMPAFGSGNKAIREREMLRAQAEGELEAVNRLVEHARQQYSDLIEAGYGQDTDLRSNRKWGYAKSKNTGVELFRKPSLEERAAATRPEDTERSTRQQQRIRAERSRYLERSPLGRAAERALTGFLSNDPGASPAARQDLAERRAALGISDVRGEVPEGVEEFASRFGRGALGVVSSIPRGIANLADLANADPVGRARYPRFAQIAQPYFDPIERAAEAFTPVDPKNESWGTAKIPQAFGSAAAFALGGGLGRLAGLSPAAVSAGIGAAANAGDIAKEMDAAGIDPGRRDAAIAVAGATGLTEAFGLGSILDKWGLKRTFIQRAVDIIEEGGQEGLQEFLNNVNAAVVGAYDPNRPLSRNVVESAILGGLVGTGFQAGDIVSNWIRDRLQGRSDATPAEPTTGTIQQPGGPPGPGTSPAQTPTIPQSPLSPQGTAPGAGPVLTPPAPAPAAPSLATGADLLAQQLARLQALRNPARAEEAAKPSLDEEVSRLEAEGESLSSFAIQNATADPETSGQALDQAMGRYGKAIKALEASPEYQNELVALARGQQLDATPYRDRLTQLKNARTQLESFVAQQKEAQGLAEKQAREAEAQARKAEAEQQRAQKAQERVDQQAAENERRRQLSDEAMRLADESAARVDELIAQGDYQNAVGELRARQQTLRSALKYLPETPEGLRQRAEITRQIESINPRIGDLKRRGSESARPQPAPRSNPLLESIVNPQGGNPQSEQIYDPGSRFLRLAEQSPDLQEETPNLLTAIRRAGGIRSDGDTTGELRRLGLKEGGTTGLLNNKSGVSIDRMREMMVSEGLSRAETVSEFYDEIEQEMRAAQGRKGREEEDLGAYYERQAEEERRARIASAGTQEAEEGEAAAPPAESFMNDFMDDLDPEDATALQGALDRYTRDNPREYVDRTRPGEPGSGGVSYSPYSVLIVNNRQQVEELFGLDLRSDEAAGIIDGLREYSVRNDIELRHLHNLLNAIRNDQLERARFEDRGLSYDEVMVADLGETVEFLDQREQAVNAELREEVSRLDEGTVARLHEYGRDIDDLLLTLHEDADMMSAFEAAVAGSDADFALFEEGAVNEYGFSPETVRYLVESRRTADRIAAQRADRGTAARDRSPTATPQDEGRPPEDYPGGQTARAAPETRLGPQESALLSRNPATIPDSEFDDHLRAVEDLRNQGIRGPIAGGKDLSQGDERQIRAVLDMLGKERETRRKAGRLGAKNPKMRIPSIEERAERRQLDEETRDLPEEERRRLKAELRARQAEESGGASAKPLSKRELANAMREQSQGAQGAKADDLGTVFDEEFDKLFGQPAKAETPAEQPALQDLGTVFDEEFDKLFGQQPQPEPKPKAEAPKPRPTPAQPTASAKESAKRVGREAAKGLDAIAKGLGKLFGDPNTMRSGPAFDEETYRQAKPLFEEAYQHFRQAAKDAREAMALLLHSLNEKYNFTPETLRRMKPYIVRFIEERSAAAEAPEVTRPALLPAKQQYKLAEQNVARLFERLGLGDRVMNDPELFLKLRNKPYIDLTIEVHDDGDARRLYLTHYIEQAGDLINDSEMVYIVHPDGRLMLEQTATTAMGREYRVRNGGEREFANMFANNLLDQGFDSATILEGDSSAEEAEESEQTAESEPQASPVADPMIAGFAKAFREGRSFRTIADARKYAEEFAGERIEAGSSLLKRVDEAIETAAVVRAREIVAEGRAAGRSEKETFNALGALLEQMPGLNVRTSTSVANQAYSTVIPLAYVASRRAGIDETTTVYEPSAGNGALLIEADPKNVTANELNPDRAQNLQDTLPGATVTIDDATAFDPGRKFDVVIANPPFGAVRTDAGSKRFQTGFYETGEIDHAISFKALEVMKDDGRAVLIVGGVPKQAASEEARSDAYNTSGKRRFYYYLYQNYNVVDHFTVAGELYEKQGAAWPVDAIVIEGRGKSSRELPAADVPRIIRSYEELSNEIQRTAPEGRQESRVLEPGRPDARRGEDAAEPADGLGRVHPPADAADRGDARSRRGESRPGDRGRAGDSGQRVRQAGLFESEGLAQDERGAPGETATSGTRAEERQDRARERESGGTERAVRENQPAPVAQRPDRGSGRTPDVKPADTETHSVYQPLSRAKSLNVTTPKNMSGAVSKALADFEEKHGSPDAYIADKLGYDSEDIPKYFSAEQVDAIALAIANIEAGKGFVIGDQTGIGKGRINAAIIRYAIKNGKTPIFVTQKPTLYADMIRDLSDIGMANTRPLITNAGEPIPLNDAATDWLQDVKDAKDAGLKPPPQPSAAKVFRAGSSHKALLENVAKTGNLRGYDVVFTTYDQMNPTGGAFDKERHSAVRRIALGGVLILDESHTAGGTAPSARGGNTMETRSRFFRDLVRNAGAVFYSSATYAKRPDVMDLYSKTDLGLLGGTALQLSELFSRGGVALQQVVASKLTEAGQYLRRERPFDGIRYDPEVVPVNHGQAEAVSQAMSMIADFDERKRAAVKAIDKEAKREGSQVSGDGSTGASGAESTNFTALMHNVIDQMLLGLKAAQAADLAIAAIRNGERPILTVSNTMESFLKEAGVQTGEAVDITFRDILVRYLRRSRDITIRDVKGNRVRRPMTNTELMVGGALNVYAEAEAFIRDADLGDIPISPIDFVRQKIEAAGYTVDEITGRNTRVDYSGQVPILRARPQSDTKIAGRRRMIRNFNDGKIDCLILNQAGSTGISLHASEKVANQQLRHMILWQAEKNIDTHMQMLGRVNRTGQVVLPRYTQMIADIPAEKRPAAVLLKKMASLNANTTASRKSAVQTEGVTDFLNELGDEVIARVMTADSEIHRKLRDPLDWDGDELEAAEAARKVTGRIPLLSLAEQESLYNLIEQEYKDFLAQKEALGENPLEAKTFEFRAERLKRELLTEGTPGSPFSEPAYLERVKIQVPVKPYTSAEVLEQLGASSLEEAQNAGAARVRTLREELRSRVAEYKDEIAAEYETESLVRGLQQKADQLFLKWAAIVNAVIPGAPVTVQTSSGGMSGIVLDVQQTGKPKNPATLGSWKVRLAVLDGRELRLSFNDLITKKGELQVTQTEEVQRYNAETGMFEYREMLPEFDLAQGTKKQIRYMVTGNVVSGYSKLPKGQILNYTDAAGTVQQGVLMPANFDAEKSLKSMPVMLRTADQAMSFLDKGGKIGDGDAETGLEIVRDRTGRQVLISVAGAKATGGKYYLSPALRALGLEFSGSRSRMSVLVSDAKAREVFDAITSGQATGEPVALQAISLKDVARQITGEAKEEPDLVKKARERLRQSSTGKRAGSGVPQLLDLAIVTGWDAYQAGMKFADWAKKVVAKAGEGVRPYLAEIWARMTEDVGPLREASAKLTEEIEVLQNDRDALQLHLDDTSERIPKGLPKSTVVREIWEDANRRAIEMIDRFAATETENLRKRLPVLAREGNRLAAELEAKGAEQGRIDERIEQLSKADQPDYNRIDQLEEQSRQLLDEQIEIEDRLAEIDEEESDLRGQIRDLRKDMASVRKYVERGRALDDLAFEGNLSDDILERISDLRYGAMDRIEKELRALYEREDQLNAQLHDLLGDDDVSIPASLRGDRNADNYFGTPRVEKQPVTKQEILEVIDNVRSEFRTRKQGAGTLWVNHQATIAIASAARSIGINFTTENGFFGISLSIATARRMVVYLDEAAGKYGKAGARLADLADNIRDGIADAYANELTGIVVVDASGGAMRELKITLREERFHQWQQKQDLMNPRFTGALNAVLRGDPVYDRIIEQLIEEGYPDLPMVLVTEASAKIASGQWQDYNLESAAEGENFLHRYYRAVSKLAGDEVLLSDAPGTARAKGVQQDVREVLGIGRGVRGSAESGGRLEDGSGTGDRGTSPARLGRRLQGRRRRGSEAANGRQNARTQSGDRRAAGGGIRRFLKDEGGSASLDLGLSKLFTPTQPKTTPLRDIANLLGDRPLEIDVNALKDEAIDAIIEAASRGANGTLPGARAMYWAQKLGAKKTADRLANKQAKFIGDAVDQITAIADAATRMQKATRGSRPYETAKNDMDRARIRLKNLLSQVGEYTHPAEYAGRAYKASLLSAPHIPFFNILEQVVQFPLHEAQRAADMLVPAKVFEKFGIRYDKAPADIRTWAPAMEREMRALRDGFANSFGDMADMLRFGVTRHMLETELAGEVERRRARVSEEKREKITGGTDKYELGHRVKGVSGLDQVITFIGRVHGAADVLFRNLIYSTALAAEAEATARQIAKDYPELNLGEKQIKELAADLAYEPSPAMIVAAADVSNRFVLDYPTFLYEALVKMRELEGIKKGGRHVEAVWKSAIDFIIPFSKIPLAAADTAFFRYSPLAFGRVASRLGKAGREYKESVRKGEAKFADADFSAETAELFRQGLVGTLTWSALGLLGSLGFIGFTGGRDDEDARRKIDNAKEILGMPYKPELTIGDTAIDVSRMGAVGRAAQTGLRAIESGTRRYDPKTGEYESKFEQYSRALAKAGKGVMLDNPVGRGAEDVIEAFDSRSAAEGLGKFAAGKTRALVPGAFRDVAKILDPTKRIPDQNDFAGRLQGDFRASIPGLREQMQPRLNALGEPVEEPNPFGVFRTRRRDPLIEDMIETGTGPSKPRRDKGESAADYNERLRAAGEGVKGVLPGLQRSVEGKPAGSRRAIYERALNPQQIERAGRVSEGSIGVERELEALRTDALGVLAGMPEYRGLREEDRKAVRDLISAELRKYRARAGSLDRRGIVRPEKGAVMPDVTPEDMARRALQNLR